LAVQKEEALPSVLQYAVGGIVAFVIVTAAAFLVIAWRNDRNAEAGPPPIVILDVRRDGIAPSVAGVESPPDAIPLERGRLYEVRLVNQTGLLVVSSADGPGITQLPFESPPDGFTGHSPVLPEPKIRLTTSSGASSAALLRFSESRDYELRIETPGRPATLQVATFTVR
jgi:hypothetical protein